MKVIEKIQKTPPGWATEPRERLSYYLYFAGQNAIYTLVSTFLTTYMLFVGVDPTKSGSVMIAVKIWDAVNDALFGVIFDSVHFKSGKKFMPWLKISTIFIPITTILLFVIPKGSSEAVKLGWFAIAYILWDTAYTLCDAPIYGIITSMTENLDERGTVLSYKSIWSGVGTAFTTVVATVLVSDKIGSTYGVVAILTAVFAAATMIPACFLLKERFGGENDEAFTLRRMFGYLFKNKYLLIYYLGFFLHSSCNVAGSMNLFVSYYLFHNELFSLVVGVLNVVPMLVISFLVPKIIRKFDKMKFYLLCTLSTVVLSGIMYAVGYNSIVAFIVLSTLRSIPLAAIGILTFMFTPDCAEYGEFKSGYEAKGITFAIQTFMTKLTGAISGSLCLFILGIQSVGWVNYDVDNFQQLNEIGANQTPHALNVLWFIYVMIPAIGDLLALITWLFYKLSDKDVQVMADCNSGKITKQEAEQLLSRKY